MAIFERRVYRRDERSEALEVLVGPESKGISASAVVRLKQEWAKQYDEWVYKSLEKHQSVYIWADGNHSGFRVEDNKAVRSHRHWR